MNAERLHIVIKTLNEEARLDATGERLSELVSAVRNLSRNPAPAHQEQVATSRSSFLKSVESAMSDEFSPSWREIMAEIGVMPYFGVALKSNVEAILAEHQMTPAVAADELDALLADLNEHYDALSKLEKSLVVLGIGSEELSNGETEIGMLIPRNAVDNELTSFAKELKKLDNFLGSISEVVTGKREHYAIRSISSSELLVFLEATLPTAAAVALIIDRLVSTIKNVLEIRNQYNKMKSFGVPEDKLSGVQEHVNKLMTVTIDELVVELIDDSPLKNNQARQNELRVSIKSALTGLAIRLDKGYNIEVRVALNKSGDEQDDTVVRLVEVIHAARPNMEYLNVEGEPILSLPEPEENEKPEPKHKASNKPKKPTEHR